MNDPYLHHVGFFGMPDKTKVKKVEPPPKPPSPKKPMTPPEPPLRELPVVPNYKPGEYFVTEDNERVQIHDP